MKRFVAAALAGLAVACGGEVATGPPSIRLGVDVCDGCGMAISDVRYAAAASGDLNGERRVVVFDDIGCLARFEAKNPAFAPVGRWAHDRNSERWIEADASDFVRSASWSTPMGSGIAAFSKPFEAVAGAAPMAWEQVVELARRGELDVPMTTSAEEDPR